MKAPFHPLYTNEVSREFLRSLDDATFEKRPLAGVSEEVLAIIEHKQAFAKAHPPIAIYRVATEGSQTRNGGVIQHATSRMEIKLENGQKIRVAKKGDCAVYPDGTTAQIVTSAGEGNSYIALVGSALSNGEEIINTPQDSFLMVEREGVPMAEDSVPYVKP